MLDNLRDDANSSPYFDDDEELPDFLEEEEEEAPPPPAAESLAFLKPIMALSPVQRFVLAALLFMMVCIIGSMFLIVFGKFAVI